ncbi:SpaA isopeptide-forming pilin-related protein [Bifidobacterium felsineum]|nr:SpaA isopeptide-forming pilin-related protein [Bifidobacterium felsineum]
MRKANSSGTLLRKTRYWWRALLGMALAVAMLAAMALPLHTAYAVDKDAANCSTTTLPIKTNGDPVTWTEVRQYIDDNFTGSKVFADAVYNAICTSGQDYRYDYDGVIPQTAADAIRYFGALDPEDTSVTIKSPLENNAVLTGIELLNNTGFLNIKDVGSHTSLDFLEDAYKPWNLGDQDLIKGPRVIISQINVLKLPKNPYVFNLPRTRDGLHGFNTTSYSRLSTNVLRQPGITNDVQLKIDTQLTGRSTQVDLGSATSSNDASTSISPTEVQPTFLSKESPDFRENVYIPGDPTKKITAQGNKIIFSIPVSSETDGAYQERVVFDDMYKYWANTAPQIQSPDYFYRVDVTYLNQLNVEGENLILSDLKFQKTDDQGNALAGANFALTKDNQPAQKIKIENGQVMWDSNGNPEWEPVGVLTSDKNGLVTVPYLTPGDYTIREISAPEGYKLDTTPHTVTVKANATSEIKCNGHNVSTPDAVAACGGEGSDANVLDSKVEATAGLKSASSWLLANNSTMRLDSGLRDVNLNNGAYVKNDGTDIDLAESVVKGVDNKVLQSLNSTDNTVNVTITPVTGDKQTVLKNVSLEQAKEYVNNLIKSNGLTADNALIEVKQGLKVYYAPHADNIIDATITNKKTNKPVNVSLEAQKHFKDEAGVDQAIANGRFVFALTPGNANAKLLASNALDASVGTDGKATWSLPSITADVFSKATKNDKGVASFNFTASEVAGSDADVKYDTTEIPVRLDVSEAKNGADGGLKVEVFVKNKSVGSATSGKDTATLKVPVKDSGIAFTNTVVPQVVKSLFSFVKRDGDSGTVLSGAKFRLFQCTAGADKCGTDLIDPDDPGSEWKKVGDDTTSGDNGMVSFDVEKPGEYRLVEIQAPAGYQKPTGQWRVTYGKDDTKPTITAIGEVPAFCDPNSDQCPGDKSSSSVSTASVMPAAAQTPLVLPNNKVIDVPSTGGRGLMLFSLAGFGLLLAGVTVLSIEARRRG